MTTQTPRTEEDKLVEFFRSADGNELGRAGDYDNLSPAETAIRAMQELKVQTRRKRYYRKAFGSLCEDHYADDFRADTCVFCELAAAEAKLAAIEVEMIERCVTAARSVYSDPEGSLILRLIEKALHALNRTAATQEPPK